MVNHDRRLFLNVGTDFVWWWWTRPNITEILLDTITLPIQAVILGPAILFEFIDANTGERGARERARRKWNREMEKAKEILNADFDKVFDDERFFCVTNTPQREMFTNGLAGITYRR